MRKIVPDPPYCLDSGQKMRETKMHLSVSVQCCPPVPYQFSGISPPRLMVT